MTRDKRRWERYNRTVRRNTTKGAKEKQTKKKTKKGILRSPKYTTAKSTRPPSQKFVINKQQRRPQRSCTIEPGQDMFICNSRGGKYPTVIERAWTKVGGEQGLTTTMTPYQTKDTY